MAHFFTIRVWRTAIVFAALLLFAPDLYSQCNPDVTPPTAVCDEFTAEALTNDGTATVMAATFDDGSTDDCCLGAFEIKRVVDGPCDGDGLPDTYGPTVTFCCADIGTSVVVSLKVNDCSGNFTECQTTVTVEDKIKPTLQAPADVTVTCETLDPTFASYGTATVSDNCCIDTVLVTVNYSQFNNICNSGTITRVFQAVDCSGNSSTLGVVTATQTIVVNYVQHYNVRFPDDVITSVQTANGFYGEPTTADVECELIGISYEDVVFTNQPDCDYKIERTWTVINWCTYDPLQGAITIPNPNPNSPENHPANLPGPIVSAPGTPSPWAPSVVKINPNDPTPTDYSTYWNANANAYKYKQIIKLIDTFFVAVQGTVFSDSTANCAFDSGESLLEDWVVRITGSVTGIVSETTTDANGAYELNLSGFDTTATVTLVASSNFGQNCQSEYTIHAVVGETVTQDIPVHLEQRCGLLSVGVATARLRRCNGNNQYTVQACNLSSESVPNAYVEVSLDDYFEYQTSSIPGTLVSGNTYSFPIGDLPAGECLNFTIGFAVSCDAQLGASHCTEAHIFPYDDCKGANSNWSGADVEVNATCDGDSVRFAIANVGDGSMTEILEFVVVEDVVMRQEGTFQLGIGETLNFSHPANGSTWRLEAQEEPLHPWGGPQAVALEGCGGINNTGLVNMFPLSDADPFEALDCQENIGSFDPNDKQGFPVGYGDEHFIKANTDIEYLIRFQNTGTDTAFLVVVLDTLPTHLDASSVRVLVASHPMEFTSLEGGILRFTFADILLPDSNVNQAGSNGFVKFRIAQNPGLVDGTKIENSAAIYFDYNEPVITNTTLHTIGTHFVSVSTDELENDGLLRAYPNPASDAVWFELKDLANAGRFELSNNLGQLVSSERFSGKQFRFERKNLPAGIYHFQITANNTQVATGKIVLR